MWLPTAHLTLAALSKALVLSQTADVVQGMHLERFSAVPADARCKGQPRRSYDVNKKKNLHVTTAYRHRRTPLFHACTQGSFGYPPLARLSRSKTVLIPPKLP